MRADSHFSDQRLKFTMKTKLYRISIPLLFFLFVLVVHFFLTDYAVYKVAAQWEEVSLKTYVINHFTNKNIYLGYSYAVAGAFASICLINLITATGGLKKSIQGITISAILWGVICFMSGCCGSPMLAVYLSLFGSAVVGATKPITAAVTTISIILSYYYVMRFSSRNLLYSVTNLSELSEENNPFAKVKRYKIPHRIVRGFRTVLMTLFRLFPNPIPLGLYAFGNPTKESPVLVTTNYELTMFRVSKVLKEIDCYLLVVDGKGVNVWCSAGAGHLNVQSVLDGIRLSKISDLVNHRTLILPQLSAVGICSSELQDKSGWSPRFGPVYIRDMERYLRNGMKKDKSMHHVEFGILQRMEMGIGSSLIFVFALTCVMVFIDVNALLILIPAVYFQSIVFAVISPYIPIRSGVIVGILYSVDNLILLSLINLVLEVESLPTKLTYLIPLMISAFYLSNEFMGWSPLIKYNLKMILTGKWEAEIRVNEEKCTGCGLCVSVCPVRVFRMEKGKSQVINRKSCEGCGACFKQCPKRAIKHSLESDNNSCGCVYCNIQDRMER